MRAAAEGVCGGKHTVLSAPEIIADWPAQSTQRRAVATEERKKERKRRGKGRAGREAEWTCERARAGEWRKRRTDADDVVAER